VVTYFEMSLREQICDIGKNLWNRGRVVCTPTGVSKGYLTPSMLPVVDLQGNVLEQHEAYRPSSEIKMLSWGPDLMSAYLTMERLEYTAQMTYLLRQIGGERDLPAEEIARLHAIFGAKTLLPQV